MLKTEVRSDTLVGNFSAIGGFFGFMYGAIYLVIGGFQDFAYETKLYRQLYTQNKKARSRGSAYGEDDYEQELEDTIMNRKQLDFHYFEHCLTRYMLVWCCCSCVKAMDCYKRRKIRKDLLEEANDRLSSETDILHFVRTSRILNFITLFSLRQNQRQLVQFFQAYHLDEDELELPAEKPPQSTIEMLRSFDPQHNHDDHRILYEITRRNLRNRQFNINYEEEDDDGDGDEYDGESQFGGDTSGQNFASYYKEPGSTIDGQTLINKDSR